MIGSYKQHVNDQSLSRNRHLVAGVELVQHEDTDHEAKIVPGATRRNIPRGVGYRAHGLNSSGNLVEISRRQGSVGIADVRLRVQPCSRSNAQFPAISYYLLI